MRVVPIAMLALAALILGPTCVGAVDRERGEKISARTLTKHLGSLDARVAYGDILIAAGETVHGPVVIVAGALDIQDGGRLEGDAWVVDGRLVLTGAAFLNGTAHLVNSEFYASHSARISGGVRHLRCECEFVAEGWEDRGELAFVRKRDPDASHADLVIAPALPTRVRYDVLTLGVKYGNDRRRDPHLRWSLVVNIPVYRETERGFLAWRAEVESPLAGGALGFSLAGYKALHTEDGWQIGRRENAALLILSSNEFADYYEKRGGEAALSLRLRELLTLSIAGRIQDDVSLTRVRAFTLLGDDDDLPENPAILEGRRTEGELRVVYDSREDHYRPEEALLLGLAVRAGRLEPDVSSADVIDYTTLTGVAGLYRELPGGLRWDTGARLFTAFEQIPPQLSQSLDGYGSIRGADNEPFAVRRGDRLAWVSTEVRLELPEVPVFKWIYSRWDLVGFADAGLVADASRKTSPLSFLDTPIREWSKSIGMGVSGESFVPYLGMYVAKEIDGRDNVRFILRLERSF